MTAKLYARLDLLRAKKNYSWILYFFLFFLALSFLWFAILPFRTFMGDDLWLIRDINRGGYASSVLHSFSDSVLGKYRPVFSVIFSLENKIIAQEWRNYFYVNIVFHAINATVIALLAYYFSGKKKWLALIAGIFFIFSRFGYHYVLQLWGLMEEIALFFLLLMIGAVVYAYAKKHIRVLYLSLVFFLLITLTHERFVFLLPFSVASFYIFPKTAQSFFTRLRFSLIPLSVVLINYLLKQYIIGVSFLSGAGSNTSAVAELDFRKILSLMWNGILNMLNFNSGSDYLSGIDFRKFGMEGYLPGIIFIISLLTLILVYIFTIRKKISSKIISPIHIHLLFMLIFLSLIMSASVSIHQEFRWLYTPFVVFMLWIFYLAGSIKINYKTIIIILVMFGSMGYTNVFYRKYLDTIYFVRSLGTADSAHTLILDRYQAELKKSEVIIVLNGYQSVKKWTMLNGYFFKQYLKEDINLKFVDNRDQVLAEKNSNQKLLVFSVQDDLYFEDITSDYNSGYNESNVK